MSVNEKCRGNPGASAALGSFGIVKRTSNCHSTTASRNGKKATGSNVVTGNGVFEFRTVKL